MATETIENEECALGGKFIYQALEKSQRNFNVTISGSLPPKKMA